MVTEDKNKLSEADFLRNIATQIENLQAGSIGAFQHSDIGRMRAIADSMLSPGSATPDYTMLELRVMLHHFREVVRCAWVLMDNAEEVDGRHVADDQDFDRLSKAMDRLDEIAAMDTSTVGRGGHAVTMAMNLLAANNRRVRQELVDALAANVAALQCSENSREIGKAAFRAAIYKYNRDHSQ